METSLITKFINVGNSKGIIIPKNFWKDFGDAVHLKSYKNKIIIEKYNENVVPRENWEEQIVKCGPYDDNEFKDFDITLNDGLHDD